VTARTGDWAKGETHWGERRSKNMSLAGSVGGQKKKGMEGTISEGSNKLMGKKRKEKKAKKPTKGKSHTGVSEERGQKKGARRTNRGLKLGI